MTSDDRYSKVRRPRAAVAQPARPSDLDRVFTTIADALFVLDSAGGLVRMNEAARLLLGLGAEDIEYAGLSRCERVARTNPRASDGAALPAGEHVLDRLLRGETITSAQVADVLIARPDGSDALVAFTGAPIRDDQGAIVGAVVAGRDETERRRLEAASRESNARLQAANVALTRQANDLQTMNRRMDQFLGMANHEMKSPLTSVSANLQLALRRLRRLAQGRGAAAQQTPTGQTAPTAPATPTTHEADAVISLLVRAQSAARRMTRLVDELLDVSRIQTGRMEARPEPCDLLALTQTVIDERRQTHPGRIIQLESSHARVDALADPDRISEVIDNYLSNAIKYSPDGTTITVIVTLNDNGTAHVSVRDEGQGIAPERHARVWNVFERLDAASSQGANDVNLGLGLHICKSIIALHGGEVGVESAVGAGSSFWFMLPGLPAAHIPTD